MVLEGLIEMVEQSWKRIFARFFSGFDSWFFRRAYRKHI